MRIVSGMRPTGKLHLGHLFGALNQWVDLQNKGEECFFFVADWHALTTNYRETKGIPDSIREMVTDWLASGVDPKRSTLFLQSGVKDHAELFLLLGMITPLGWLERNPAYKEAKQELADKDLSNLGFLSYPVLQTADIVMYKGAAVPVGHDQLPHLELAREIVRRFNGTYGEIFPEPKALLTKSPKIGGVDGRKMSKSYNNAIFLSDSEEEIRAKVKVMVTDPKRARRQDPGDPDTCNLYPLHEIYSSPETIRDVRKGCTTAGIGCVDCKGMLFPTMLKELAEIRKRREEIARSPEKIDRILEEGTEKARAIAAKTMKEVRKALHLGNH